MDLSFLLKDPLFHLGGTEITFPDLVLFTVLCLLTWIFSRILERATRRAFQLRKVRDEGAVHAAGRVIRYLTLLLGLGVAASQIGIHSSTILGAGAVVAAVVGFALQNIAQNFFAGFILLFERSITAGDILEVEGELIRVSDIGIRATVARTLNEEEIIIPNSTLVQSSVKNFTLGDKIYRLRTLVGVTYSSDMSLVRKTLESVSGGLAWRLKNRKPRILMREFGDSSVVFEVSVWMDHPWERYVRLSDLNEAIWWGLKDAGITIAFPQLDVHFDTDVVQSLRSRASA